MHALLAVGGVLGSAALVVFACALWEHSLSGPPRPSRSARTKWASDSNSTRKGAVPDLHLCSHWDTSTLDKAEGLVLRRPLVVDRPGSVSCQHTLSPRSPRTPGVVGAKPVKASPFSSVFEPDLVGAP